MARILALFAVAPAADPKSLLGAIDVPYKMSGNLNFFNFENPIFKFQTFLKNISQDHSKLDSKLSPFPLAGSHRRHEGLGLLDTKFSTTTTAVVSRSKFSVCTQLPVR